MDTEDCPDCGELLSSDEHRASCLYDPSAAKRLEQAEGRETPWDLG